VSARPAVAQGARTAGEAEGTPVTARLWLVRHAQPEIAPGICYGQLDVPAQAAATQAAARALAQALPSRVAALCHSPLQRCELLALALQALRPDLAARPEPRIAEVDFGTWEGRAWDAIDRTELDDWAAHLATHAPGGGEPLAAMLARVADAQDEARRLSAAGGGGDVVWITHAGVARCVAWLRSEGRHGRPHAARWPVPAPGYGAWTVVPLAVTACPAASAR